MNLYICLRHSLKVNRKNVCGLQKITLGLCNSLTDQEEVHHMNIYKLMLHGCTVAWVVDGWKSKYIYVGMKTPGRPQGGDIFSKIVSEQNRISTFKLEYIKETVNYINNRNTIR